LFYNPEVMGYIKLREDDEGNVLNTSQIKTSRYFLRKHYKDFPNEDMTKLGICQLVTTSKGNIIVIVVQLPYKNKHIICWDLAKDHENSSYETEE
jgi:hypothetical protein